MRLIFLGPPGAGKGSQAKLLSSRLKVPHLATGDLIRSAMTNQTEIGLKAKPYMDQGLLVPDDLVVSLLMESFDPSGFTLDGFPRTIPQAETLKKKMEDSKLSIDRVFFIDTPENIIIERLSHRRTCEHCGRVYNLVSHPPIFPFICDADAGTLITRTDDQPETIKIRQERYRQQTTPLLSFYADCLVTIDGSKSLAEVEKAISLWTLSTQRPNNASALEEAPIQ